MKKDRKKERDIVMKGKKVRWIDIEKTGERRRRERERQRERERKREREREKDREIERDRENSQRISEWERWKEQKGER